MKLCPTCAETLQYFGADVEVVPESECEDCPNEIRPVLVGVQRGLLVGCERMEKDE